MLKLVGSETYVRIYKMKGVDEDKCPKFTLRKLTAGDVNAMDDQVTTLRRDKADGPGSISLLVGTSRKLKIRLALVNWENIVLDDSGAVAPCNDENKEKLPAAIQSWLEKDIDAVNSLQGVDKEEEKNS